MSKTAGEKCDYPLPEIVNRLNTAIVAIVKQAETRKVLAEQGSEPVGNSVADFREFVRTKFGKWAALVEISGARLD